MEFKRFKGLKNKYIAAAEILGHEFAHAVYAKYNPQETIRRDREFDEIKKMMDQIHEYNPEKIKEINYNLWFALMALNSSFAEEEVLVAYIAEYLIYEDLQKIEK